jgi:hypothetical protein
MRGTADEILVLVYQAEGRGATNMADGWVDPTASRRHPAEIEIGQDLVGKAPGGRSGRGFPPAIVVRQASSLRVNSGNM